MNKYELAVVVSANVDDEAKTKAVDKCKALIERFGGTVTNVDDWGFYYFIQFDAEASVPAELESRVRIVDNVIRYLCVRNDEA